MFKFMSKTFKTHKLPLEDAAAAAKSLQSCLTLCDPRDGSPPGSPVPGILQARTLEWVAISSFNAWKWKVKVKSLGRVQLLATPTSRELCMQVKKQQLELDMEQQTGSKSGKEFVKAVYCHPAYLTYTQSTSCKNAGLNEAQAGIKIAGENINNLRHADDTTLMVKVKKN